MTVQPPRGKLSLTPAAILVWVGLLIGVAIHGFFYPESHTVYNIYGPASRHWWAGEDLYAPVVKGWWEAGNWVTTTDYYRYSPLFAVAVTPVAVLPDFLGNPLWKVLNAGVYALGLWCAARRLLPDASSRVPTAAFLLLVLPVSVTSLYIGQANLFVVGATLLGLSAAADNRWSTAAGWLAAATLIKGYPLALALLLIALYPRRFTLRFVLALAVGLLLPFLTQPLGTVLAQYTSWWSHLSDSTVLMRERLRSVDQLFALCHVPLSPRLFSLLELAAGAAVLGLCALQSRRTGQIRERLTWMLLLYSAWVVLFGPATESCTYAVMGPALAWSLIDAFRRPAGWGVRILLIACLILMGPVVTDLFGSTVRLWAHRYGFQPIGGLLYLAYLLTETARLARQRPPSELAPALAAQLVLD
jgi:hypothetical protein